MGPRPTVQSKREAQRLHILEEFEARASQRGPRGVVMAELARDLGISTRTLYQQFASKADLVREIMERWAAELEVEQRRRLRSDLSPKGRMVDAAQSWIEGQDRFSAAFWAEVVPDFPDAAQIMQDQVRKSLGTARNYLAPLVHEDFSRDLAISLLNSSIRHALDPKRCDRLGLSRLEAVKS